MTGTPRSHAGDNARLDTDTHDARPPREWLWLGGILIVALILRAINLDASLWYDEIDTLVEYVRLPTTELLTSYHSLNNHMLFSLEAQVSVALFGESAWALRLPAMLMGVASIWALWLLAKEVAGPWEARISALLLAVSYHHVWFSQNARGYTGLLFFALIATYFLIRAIRAPTRRIWLGYGLAFALSMYTHLSAVFLFAAHGLVYLGLLFHRSIRPRERPGPAMPLPAPSISEPLLGVAFGCLIALVLYAPVLPQMAETFGAVRMPEPDVTDAAVASIAQWSSPLWMVQEIGRSFGALGFAAGLVLLPSLAVLALGMFEAGRKAPILPLVFAVHIPMTVAILVALSFRVWPRYFFVDIGYICIFLVIGAGALGRICAPFCARCGWSIGGRTLGRAFAILGVAASLVLLPKNYAYPKQDFAGARDLVEGRRSADSRVLTLGLASMPFAAYYAPDWQAVETLEALTQVVDSGSEVWLVYAFPKVTERRYADIADFVSARFDKVEYLPGTLGGGGVLVFRLSRN